MIVPVQALADHLNIIGDGESALLLSKLQVAEVAVGNFIGLDLATEYSAYVPELTIAGATGPDGIYVEGVITPSVDSNAPAPIKEAVLKYAAHLYDYRELTAVDDERPGPPLGVFDLVGPYRKWVF